MRLRRQVKKQVQYTHIHCKKGRVNVIKLWSPQLHLSGHLHVVIKERAHKCNAYFDPTQISKREVQLDQDSQFQLGGEGMPKVHAAVEVQLAACKCSIIASPSYSYLKLRNLIL